MTNTINALAAAVTSTRAAWAAAESALGAYRSDSYPSVYAAAWAASVAACTPGSGRIEEAYHAAVAAADEAYHAHLAAIGAYQHTRVAALFAS